MSSPAAPPASQAPDISSRSRTGHHESPQPARQEPLHHPLRVHPERPKTVREPGRARSPAAGDLPRHQGGCRRRWPVTRTGAGMRRAWRRPVRPSAGAGAAGAGAAVGLSEPARHRPDLPRTPGRHRDPTVRPGGTAPFSRPHATPVPTPGASASERGTGGPVPARPARPAGRGPRALPPCRRGATAHRPVVPPSRRHTVPPSRRPAEGDSVPLPRRGCEGAAETRPRSATPTTHRPLPYSPATPTPSATPEVRAPRRASSGSSPEVLRRVRQAHSVR